MVRPPVGVPPPAGGCFGSCAERSSLNTQRVISSAVVFSGSLFRERFCLLKQLNQRDAEGIGQRCNGRDGRAALAALDTADVVAMDAGLVPKLLLRQITLLTQGTQGSTEAEENTIRLWHRGRALQARTKAATA